MCDGWWGAEKSKKAQVLHTRTAFRLTRTCVPLPHTPLVLHRARAHTHMPPHACTHTQIHTHTHTHTHIHTCPTRMHTHYDTHMPPHGCTHTHTHTHATRTHTHTHDCLGAGWRGGGGIGIKLPVCAYFQLSVCPAVCLSVCLSICPCVIHIFIPEDMFRTTEPWACNQKLVFTDWKE